MFSGGERAQPITKMVGRLCAYDHRVHSRHGQSMFKVRGQDDSRKPFAHLMQTIWVLVAGDKHSGFGQLTEGANVIHSPVPAAKDRDTYLFIHWSRLPLGRSFSAPLTAHRARRKVRIDAKRFWRLQERGWAALRQQKTG